MELYGRNFLDASKGFAWTVIKKEPGQAYPLTWGLDSSAWVFGQSQGGAYYTATGSMVRCKRTGFGGFSAFAIATSDTTLPLELITFTGKNLTKNKNLLNWTTATEKNSDYFLLQRSSTGEKFESIGTVKGAGTSSDNQYYSYVDENPYNGINYYRLKIVDTDGSSVFSEVITVDNSFDEFVLDGIRPNPALSQIRFDMKAPEDGSVRIQIVDVLGKTMYSQNKVVKKGMNSISTNVSDYTAGVYYIKINYIDENRETKEVLSKFVKL